MRKLSVVLLAACLILSTAGFASAALFTETKDLDTWLYGSGSYNYFHATPADFQVPYDTVNSATVTLDLKYVNDENDYLLAEGKAVGVLTNTEWVWSWKPFPGYSVYPEYDVASIFNPWTSGSNLDLTISYKEPWYASSLHLKSSTFELDYQNGAAPVPEPGTMLLLGAGLLGLAGYGRRKFNK